MTNVRTLASLLSRLWRQISGRRQTQLVALVALMLLGTIAEIFSIGMVLPFLGAFTAPERIFEHPMAQPIVTALGLTSPDQILLPMTVLFGVAVVIAGATRLALLWVQMRLGNAIGSDLGYSAYRRTLYQPYARHALRNSSEVIAVLVNKINISVYSIVIPLLTLAMSAITVCTIVLIMIFVEPELTTMMFAAFGCLYVVVAYLSRKRLVRDSHLVATGQRAVTQVVQESLGSIRDVLIDGLQDTYSRIYHRNDRQLRRAIGNTHIIGGAPRPLIEAFGLAIVALVAYVLTARQGMSTALPMLGAVALAAQRLLPLVQQGYASWAYIMAGHASLHDVLLLLEQPLPDDSDQPRVRALQFKNEIGLTNVCFRYSPGSPWIVRGVELKIPRGSRVGFIGATGSGKSTLLDIIMGLLTPVSGSVCVDGVIVNESNRRGWQSHIAHVPQTIYLIDATVAENIAFGVQLKDIDIARVKEAARRAQIAETVESWRDGYDTVVGEGGIRLSGGQRQRIGIARALYKRADVIVLDEATSALDDDTERAVMDAIEALDKEMTIMIVAHRVSTLQRCDRVIELAGGTVRRVGTYQDIVSLPRN